MKQIEGILTTQQHTTPSAPPSAPPKMGSGTAHSAADVAAVADQRTAEPRSVSTWIDTTLCTSPTSRDTISGHGLSGAEGPLDTTLCTAPTSRDTISGHGLSGAEGPRLDTTLCTSPTSRDTISGHGLSGAEGTLDTTLCTSPTSRDTTSGHGLSGAEGQLLPRPVRDADSRDGVRDASRAYNRQDTSRPRHHRMPPEHIDAIDSVAHIGESNQNNALPTHMTIDMAENTDAKRQKTSRKGGNRTAQICDFEQRDTRNAHTTLQDWVPECHSFHSHNTAGLGS